MSQYVDDTINKMFKNGLPNYKDLEVLMEEFPKTYFSNHETSFNKPYEPDYLVIKLLLCSIPKYQMLAEKEAARSKSI